MFGDLAARVAAAVTALLQAGRRARSLALNIPAGHTLDHTDITGTNQAIIHFERAHTTRAAPKSAKHTRITTAVGDAPAAQSVSNWPTTSPPRLLRSPMESAFEQPRPGPHRRYARGDASALSLK